MLESSWPPKSPKEALLSSPAGRKRYEEMRARPLASGSPIKGSSGVLPLQRRDRNQQIGAEDETEDEDEETLELKLAAIEARLKLKKLQQNKAKAGLSSSDAEGDERRRPTSSLSTHSTRPRSRLNSTRDTAYECGVQVPVSPTKRPPIIKDPESPRRILLGIDKGLKASDVSLRRRPSSKALSRSESSFGLLQRSNSRTGLGMKPENSGNMNGIKHSKSFSEKMAESRAVGRSRMERAAKVQSSRSSAFQYDKAELENYKAVAATTDVSFEKRSITPSRTNPTECFSRDDILSAYHGKSLGLRKQNTAPDLHTLNRRTSTTTKRNGEPLGLSKSETGTSNGSDGPGSPEPKSVDPSKFESYSALHLANRILPHSFLSRTLKSKTVFHIPDLLRTIKAPDFELSDVDGDYVVFGIVASKSEPKIHKESNKVMSTDSNIYDDGSNNTNKYMAITLTDLKWTIDLFLFDTAFPRYYRLSEGVLIAILNPTILPPPPNRIDTNRFSLSVSSSDDTILEIGTAQDIGFCKAVRKDGKICQSWVDARKTEFCDFHVDIQVRRAQSQRMGVNNGTGMLGPGGRSGSRLGFYGDARKPNDKWRDKGLKPEGAQYDAVTQSTFFVAPSRPLNSSNFLSDRRYGSASSLNDVEGEDPFLAVGMNGRGLENREERMRRRLAEHQQERDIARKLGSKDGSVGSEYLRARLEKSDNGSSSSPSGGKSRVTLQEGLNLIPSISYKNDGGGENFGMKIGSGRKAADVKLGKMKRVRDIVDESSKFRGAPKKTRFITSKGIREAGRDSFGGLTTSTSNVGENEDDDELDIVMN